MNEMINQLREENERLKAERDALVAFANELHCAVLAKNYPVCKALLDEKLPDISNKRDIEQQIKGVSESIDMYEDFEKAGEPLGVKSVLYTKLGQLEQLRKELGNV